VKQRLGLFFSVLLVAISALGTCEVAQAQQATGRIIGNVSDPGGEGIPGVQIKATNAATQVSQETKIDREEFFEITEMAEFSDTPFPGTNPANSMSSDLMDSGRSHEAGEGDTSRPRKRLAMIVVALVVGMLPGTTAATYWISHFA
jgi:hypothetical protein